MLFVLAYEVIFWEMQIEDGQLQQIYLDMENVGLITYSTHGIPWRTLTFHVLILMQIKIGLMMTQWRVETCRLLHLSEIYSSILLCSKVLYSPIRLYTQRDGSTQNMYVCCSVVMLISLRRPQPVMQGINSAKRTKGMSDVWRRTTDYMTLLSIIRRQGDKEGLYCSVGNISGPLT
jgi:hypothetical protein